MFPPTRCATDVVVSFEDVYRFPGSVPGPESLGGKYVQTGIRVLSRSSDLGTWADDVDLSRCEEEGNLEEDRGVEHSPWLAQSLWLFWDDDADDRDTRLCLCVRLYCSRVMTMNQSIYECRSPNYCLWCSCASRQEVVTLCDLFAWVVWPVLQMMHMMVVLAPV